MKLGGGGGGGGGERNIKPEKVGGGGMAPLRPPFLYLQLVQCAYMHIKLAYDSLASDYSCLIINIDL